MFADHSIFFFLQTCKYIHTTTRITHLTGTVAQEQNCLKDECITVNGGTVCPGTNCRLIVRLQSCEEFAQCDKSGPKRERKREVELLSCFSNSDIAAL